MTRQTQPIASDAPRARKLLGLWDRGDGYDARDPNAPYVPECPDCESLMFDGFCAPCQQTIAEELAFTMAVPHSPYGFAIVDRDAA